MSTANLQRFAELVSRDQFNLAEASLLLAHDAYPNLRVDEFLGRIDEIAATVRGRFAADAFPEQRIVALNKYLFGELGFAGEVDRYYDPRNSYLNDVIERKRGIPITLSILYIEIGRRIGLALHGVSFPGHFLVKMKVRRGQLVLDPFSGGEPQGVEDLKKRLEQVLPPKQQPVSDIDPYIQAASSQQIIARMLRNLKVIFTQSGALEQTLAVQNRMLLVNPEAVEELRDRGLVYQKLDCFRPALSDLQNYLRRRPDASDGSEIRVKIEELKVAVGRLN